MWIRPAEARDRAAIWAILEPIIRAGETLALPMDMTERAALAYWLGPDRETFVACETETGDVLGTCYVRANQPGGGAHVANAGYAVHPEAIGRGIARMMAAWSLDHAQARGFRAMQFNFVVSTNEPAVHLWRSLGFVQVGSLPGAFLHPRLGAVDALVMFRPL